MAKAKSKSKRDWTQRVNVDRALQHLAGLAKGISLDYEITDGEVGALTEWLSMYAGLLHIHPFADLADLVEKIVADGKVDEAEREELLDWCQRFLASDSVAVVTTTDAIRRLHAVLHGIAADGVVTAQEAVDLREWLEDHIEVANTFPFCEVLGLLGQVLADGKIDEDELAELLSYCDQFVERAAEGSHDRPVGKTLTSICDRDVEVAFAGRTFCFTGKAQRVRKDLHAAVEALGGVPLEGVTTDLDYLVIGALSQPAWAFASYGRKIEQVLSLKQRGKEVAILHEHDLDRALGHR